MENTVETIRQIQLELRDIKSSLWMMIHKSLMINLWDIKA